MTDNRTIVFGLDGACIDLIEPWLDDGTLPTLAGLIDRGGRADLSSCDPATTPPAWTSLTTGVNPGDHGVFGFYGRSEGSYEVHSVSDGDVYARRLWDYLSLAGETAVVVNVPVTHPAREVEGALVPGYLAPDEPATFPPGILPAVGMDDYRVYAPSEAEDVPEAQLLEEWLALTASRRDLAFALTERFDPDLLFLEFQKTDGAVHKFEDRANVRRIYERVDACMGEILDAVGGDPNVFVVSDHGIGQEKEWAVALNTWLVEEGYATTRRAEGSGAGGAAGGEELGWLDRAIGDDGGDESAGGSDPQPSTVGRLLGALGRAGVTKQRLERLLSALGLYDLAVRLAPEGAGHGLDREVIDRAASTAFYEGMGFSGVDVGVVINDERFYPGGVVSEAEYEDVRGELIEALRGMTGPDGQRPFSRVRRREDVYTGPRTGLAPDVVLEQSADYVIGSQYPRGQSYISTDPGRVDHTREGLIVAAGPDVVEGWELAGKPSIVDVTPTLLHLHDVALAERFDGASLASVLAVDREPEYREYGPYRPPSASGATDEEAAALEDRLRSMGYLE